MAETQYNTQIIRTVQERPCSISLTKNAKNEYQWELKAYCEVDEFESALQKIEAAEKTIKEKWGTKNE